MPAPSGFHAAAAALALLLWTFGASAWAQPAGSPLTAAVIEELNRARADPAAYAQKLKAGPQTPLTADAVAFLERQAPRPPLTSDDRLAAAAARHAAEQGRLGQASHVGADGSHPRDRMMAQGVFSSVYAELVSTRETEASAVVAQLIVDPPGPGHPHRLDIFDPLLKIAGVACGPNAKLGPMCVVDLAATPMTAGTERVGPGSTMAAAGAAPTPTPAPAPAPPTASPTQSVPGEVIVELSGSPADTIVQALAAAQKLETVERFTARLTDVTLVLLHIPDARPPSAVAATLATAPGVVSSQPNFLFDLAQEPAAGGPPQYAAEKLRLIQAHQIARGEHVLVGVVDSQVDAAHPELHGAIAGSFDAVGGAARPDAHGTAIAALIVAHARLTGAAPAARLLTARAFRQGGAAQGTSFNIVKAFDWAASHGARVINLSFTGPKDPALARALAAAAGRGIVLVAAAGNSGPSAAPLYPAAEASVIAVSATDADDRVFAGANRGAYIALAAPGVEVLTAAPQGAYQVSSGTSLSAAEVSGVIALMLERRPGLSPRQVRQALVETGRPLPPAPGARLALVDAYRATAAAAPRGSETGRRQPAPAQAQTASRERR